MTQAHIEVVMTMTLAEAQEAHDSLFNDGKVATEGMCNALNDQLVEAERVLGVVK